MHERVLHYPLIIQHALVILLFTIFALVFIPGLTGPWLFDDYTNLLQNNFIRIETLDWKSLYKAAISIDSGPLRRPVAMTSFALNYYFAGSFASTFSFKLVNLLIHILNGILIFWLLRMVIERFRIITEVKLEPRKRKKREMAIWMAMITALLWLVHPIQITSVLYVVQRMTELSALFVLIGLISYFKARLLTVRPGKLVHSAYFWFFTSVIMWLLALFSKENALIAPLLVLALELTLFPREKPWRLWNGLSYRTKSILTTALVIVGMATIYFVFQHALGGYSNRPFTLTERLLTESRILFFYLQMIFVPQINLFSIYHDYTNLSTSLISPWVTLLAVLGHLLFITLAILFRKRSPLLTLGVLWFYIGHLLESTIFALELIHEHRNYLPSIGALLTAVEFIRLGGQKIKSTRLVWVLPVFLVFFSAVTATRTNQWSSSHKLYAFELIHHPTSAMAHSGLGGVLTAMGRHTESENILKLAAELGPNEPSHLIWLYSMQAQQGKALDPQVQSHIIKLLDESPLTSTTIKTLGDVAGCLVTWCRILQKPMEEWLQILLQRKNNAGDKSYYYYLLGINQASVGKADEAVAAFWKSVETDPKYLHPLFNLAAIYIHSKNLDEAEHVLNLLYKANNNNLHAMPQQVELVAADVKKLRDSLGTPTLNQ